MYLTGDQVQALKDWAANEQELSLKEDIVEVLKNADTPLTQGEILERVGELREKKSPN